MPFAFNGIQAPIVTVSKQDADRLQALRKIEGLRKKRAWREVIRLGERLLARRTVDDDVLVHVELGKAYLEVRQFDAARNVLRMAERLQPRSSLVIRRMGELEVAVGNYSDAIKYWQAVMQKNSENADSFTFYNLAKAFRKLGRLDAAKLNASQGLAKFPDDPGLRDELQRVTSMMNDQSFAADKAPAGGRTGLHPYRDLDDRNYWNKTVSSRNSLEIDNWYEKKFSINGLSISTAGSCFAQHIGRELRDKGYEYVDVEPAPDFLRAESHHDYGYGIYSARFGNIYTSRQLLQLVQRSLGLLEPQDSVWKKNSGYVDAFRPTIEPEPFERVEDVLESRQTHLAAVERMFKLSNVFIFTMGLTEAWVSNDDAAVYPVAPGVAGGTYDATRYSFKNFSYPEICEDMERFFSLVSSLNETLRIILTVSPVPLMATASSNNVVVASTYSKSVLRSVAGFLADKYDSVDYFPSFEIVGSHVMRGQFFNPDGRTVSPYGVSHVMKQFFAQHVPPQLVLKETPVSADPDDIVCDEELLKEFGGL
jgi:tetratricopeptide (TPR) repeat protein